ncbi:hypothetical protein [Natrarchaeobius chitinivorans]|nr:hypothetical protein [Natrarchaeobius chitinivorans]
MLLDESVLRSNGDGSFALTGVLILMSLFGIYAVWKGSNLTRHGYRIFSNDPIPAAEAREARGVVEVEGTAHPVSGSTSSKYTDTPSLVHTWKKRKEETGSGSDDDSATNMRTLDSGRDSVPFVVRDESGEIVVDPAAASLSLSNDKTGYSQNRDIRKYESRLHPGDDVHVYGQRNHVTEKCDDFGGEDVVIGEGEEVSQFRVSDTSPTRTSLRLVAKGIVIFVIGVGITIGAGVMALLQKGVM